MRMNDGIAVAEVRLIDEDRVAEHVLQHLTDDPKVGRRLPASLELTTPRHPVTFTADLHVVGDRLCERARCIDCGNLI